MAFHKVFKSIRENLADLRSNNLLSKRNIIVSLIIGITALSIPLGIQLTENQKIVRSRAQEASCPEPEYDQCGADLNSCDNVPSGFGYDQTVHVRCTVDEDGNTHYNCESNGTIPGQCGNPDNPPGDPPPDNPPNPPDNPPSSTTCTNFNNRQSPAVSSECTSCIFDKYTGVRDSLRLSPVARCSGATDSKLASYWCNGGMDDPTQPGIQGSADCPIKKRHPACAATCNVNLGSVTLCGVSKQWANVDKELWEAGYSRDDLSKYDHGVLESAAYTNAACPSGGGTPNPPANLRVSCISNNTQAVLSWDAPSGNPQVNYDIRIDGPATFTRKDCSPHNVCVNNFSGTSMTVNITDPSASFNWWVHSLSGNILSTAASKRFSCTGNTSVLTPPANFTAACDASGITTTWSQVSGSNVSYKVRYDMDPVNGNSLPTVDSSWSGNRNNTFEGDGFEDNVTATNHRFTTARPGHTYQAWVQSYSPDSNPDHSGIAYSQEFSCPAAPPPAASTYSISGKVFVDRDGDGEQDCPSGPDCGDANTDDVYYTASNPKPNIKVINSDGSTRATVQTAGNGNADYSFSGIPAGSYKLRLEAPSGYISPSDKNITITNTNLVGQKLGLRVPQTSPSPQPPSDPLPSPSPAQSPSSGTTLSLACDFNGNNSYDNGDFTLWLQEFLRVRTTTQADCTGDGRVDLLDFNTWRNLRYNLGGLGG